MINTNQTPLLFVLSSVLILKTYECVDFFSSIETTTFAQNVMFNRLIRSNEDELSKTERSEQDLRQTFRSCNLLIHGMPQHKEPIQEVKWIARKLGIFGSWRSDVIGYYRINSTSSDIDNQPLVIQMKDRNTKYKWIFLYRKKRMWYEKWYLNEHLSSYNFRLLAKSKIWARENNYHCVWIKDCRIYIQANRPKKPESRNDTIYEIKSFKTLESIPSLKS
uniref:Uncharacterized protein n=1 Tax=Cacopsylla melanoneura TaxID=428564 RepID=A0A8D8ZA02_9HEMI